jgi:hypothetical protein
MDCLKSGAKLDSPKEVPLCEECERKGGSTVKLSDPSEVLELQFNSQKQHGNLPNDFRLSDVARTVAKNMIYELLERGEKSESVTNAIFGFCYGYLCSMKENNLHF